MNVDEGTSAAVKIIFFRHRIIALSLLAVFCLVFLPLSTAQDNPGDSGAQRTAQVLGDGRINVREQASAGSAVVGTVVSGDILIVLGDNEDGSWLNVELPSGVSGWVRADLVQVAEAETLADAVNRAWNFSGTTNADWRPYIYKFDDGIEMALVPVGCFTLGTTEQEFQDAVSHIGMPPDRVEAEQPAGTYCVNKPFWIDVTEIRQADFERLGGVKAHQNAFVGDNLPVETITWFDARDFCELRDLRLPSEVEWEYAARGIENLIFPWGSEFDGSLLNFCDGQCQDSWRAVNYDDGYQQSAPVGSYPLGASWVGAEDLAGNLGEWTNTSFAAYPYDPNDGREAHIAPGRQGAHVIRGGSWRSFSGEVRASARDSLDPTFLSNDLGFRCARSIDTEYEPPSN